MTTAILSAGSGHSKRLAAHRARNGASLIGAEEGLAIALTRNAGADFAPTRQPAVPRTAAAMPPARLAQQPTTRAEIEAKARTDAIACVAAVTSSAEYEGRERLAHQLLNNPHLSAREIITALSHTPRDTGGTKLERQRAAIAAAAAAAPVEAPAPAAPAASGPKQRSTDTDAIWARAYANVRAEKSLGARQGSGTELAGNESASDAVWSRAWTGSKAQRAVHGSN